MWRGHWWESPNSHIVPDRGEPTPTLPIIRMGRGMMMSVDHNRNLEWVGGFAAIN
jgi:hypothetical protein